MIYFFGLLSLRELLVLQRYGDTSLVPTNIIVMDNSQ